MNKLQNGSIAVGAPGSNARNLAEIADQLLSLDHDAVIASKRENFKNIIEKGLNAYFGINFKLYDNLAEFIVKKTFDAGVVN